jgi:zinc protease
MEHERVATPSVGFYYATPGVGGLSEADGMGLSLLGQATGTSIIGRLYHTLVTEKKLAIDFSASHWYDLRGGILSFSATAAPGVPMPELEAAVARELAALVRDGVTVAEIEDAKKAYLAAKAYVDDNHRALANAYGTYLTRGLTVADVETRHEITARVTADDVNKLIARFMAKAEPLVAVLSPKAPKLAGPAPR